MNKPGEKEARFRERSILRASELNLVVSATVKRITSGAGLSHKTIRNQLVLSLKDKNKGLLGIKNPGEDCDCQALTNVEECWNFAWSQSLNGGGSIGGTFSLHMTWTLTDIGGTPLDGCSEIITRLNCEDPCDFAWLLAPQEVSEFMNKYPFDGAGDDKVDLLTPWGDVVSYGFGFDPSNFIIVNADCGDTSVDLLSISPFPTEGCPDETGDGAPCIPSDTRPVCVTACAA